MVQVYVSSVIDADADALSDRLIEELRQRNILV